MKREDFTKERFVLKVPLYLDRKRTFELMASSSGLVSWFLGKVDFFDHEGNLIPDGNALHVDDTFQWTWQKGYQIKGKVLDYVDGEKFGFTFGENFSVVFMLDGIGDGNITEMALTQFNHKPSESNEFGFLNCCVCWTFFLTNLKSVGENNIDLREDELIDEVFINQ